MGCKNSWPDFPARIVFTPNFLYEDQSGMRILAKLQSDNPHLCPSLGDKAARHNSDYSPDVLTSLGASMFHYPARQPDTLHEYRLALAALASKGLKLPEFDRLEEDNMRLLYAATREYLAHRLRVKDSLSKRESSLALEHSAH